MALRDKIAVFFTPPALWAVWFGPPVLCLAIPGVGLIPAFLWIIALMWLGRQRVADIGLRKPENVPRFLAMAIAIGVSLWAFAAFGLDPLAARLAGAPPDLSMFEGIEGNLPLFLTGIALSWVSGALMEEVVFRGFFIQYGVRLLGERSAWALVAASALIFGFMHLYQGTTGVISTGIMGFILGAAFLLAKRDLLLVMVAHGVIDTMYFTLAFLGLKELS